MQIGRPGIVAHEHGTAPLEVAEERKTVSAPEPEVPAAEPVVAENEEPVQDTPVQEELVQEELVQETPAPELQDSEEAPAEEAPCCCEQAPVGIGKLAAWAVVAICAGVAVVAAHKLIQPRTITQVVEKEVIRELQIEPDGIPLALLPETADAALWETVANMSGTIGGNAVQFKRGLAESSGTTYKVCLDFCRNGEKVFVKVVGNGNWVAQVGADGKIVKAYPARANSKPLKDIFGK